MVPIFTIGTFLTLLVTAAFTLFVKFIWDRWFSKSSRITQVECDLRRQTCRSDFKEINIQLTETIDRIAIIEHGIKVIIITHLKLLQKEGIDTSDIEKLITGNNFGML